VYLLDTCIMFDLVPGKSLPQRDVADWHRFGAWQAEMVRFHAGRIIPVDIDIAIRAGALLSIARTAGFDPDTEDAWIAATAELHGMEVLTFNEADFRTMRVAFRNPLTGLPPDRAR
jgi:hypothetical protein